MRARHFGCEVCQRRDGAFHYFRDAEGLTEHLRFVSHLLQLVASATHTLLASRGPVGTMCLGDVLLVCTSSWHPIESVFSRRMVFKSHRRKELAYATSRHSGTWLPIILISRSGEVSSRLDAGRTTSCARRRTARMRSWHTAQRLSWRSTGGTGTAASCRASTARQRGVSTSTLASAVAAAGRRQQARRSGSSSSTKACSSGRRSPSNNRAHPRLQVRCNMHAAG